MIINTDEIIKIGDSVMCNADRRKRFKTPIDSKGNNRRWKVASTLCRTDNPCDMILELVDYYSGRDNWYISISEIGKSVFKEAK